MQEISDLLATLGTYMRWAIVILGAYGVALWWALVVWTYLDVRSRTRDFVVKIASTLLVLVFFLPGVILYMILRPKETLNESYERDLEEEYLLRDLEDKESCPGCGMRAQGDYLFCPNCGSGLKQECPSCGKNLRLDWNSCPFCGRRVGPRLGPVAATEQYEAVETRRAAGMDSPA